MITELNELSDIGDEFGKTLSQAGNMKYFYDNKIPILRYSPLFPEKQRIG